MTHQLVALTPGVEHCACGASMPRLVEHLAAVFFDAWDVDLPERRPARFGRRPGQRRAA